MAAHEEGGHTTQAQYAARQGHAGQSCARVIDLSMGVDDLAHTGLTMAVASGAIVTINARRYYMASIVSLAVATRYACTEAHVNGVPVWAKVGLNGRYQSLIISTDTDKEKAQCDHPSF
jgi:hypothetical protein